jgi:hypothetical protein
MKGAHPGLVGPEGLAHEACEQVAGAAVVVPAGLRLGLIGQGGGKGGDVVLPDTEQHRDDVGLVFRIIAHRAVAEMLGLAEPQTVHHAQHLVDGDMAPLVAGGPSLHRHGPGDVQLALAHQNSD